VPDLLRDNRIQNPFQVLLVPAPRPLARRARPKAGLSAPIDLPKTSQSPQLCAFAHR